ncbi:hypothetical protein RCF19_33885 [Rhodococcus qingshengii]
MTGNEIRAARLRLLNERLATIRSKQRTLFDSLGDSPIPGTRYTEARVAEINTNGRIAELGWGELVAAIPDGWELQESAQLEEVSRVRQRDLEASQATTARWRARAEKAEATIARVITALEAAEKSVPDDWGVTYIYTSQLRAALEGEQQ